MKVQRLRITFSRGEEVKYITHLDLMRFWERALRRAGIPLAYSEGYSPHPRLSLAAPLAVGVTSSGELMDVYLSQRITPHHFLKEVSKQLPPGIDIHEVREVGLSLPSLQSEVRWADYQVEVAAPPEEMKERVQRFLAAATFPWQHTRDKEVRRYDLRALVHSIDIQETSQDRCLLQMRLRTDNSAAGRPEQVTAALGLAQRPRRVHRLRLILAETSPAREAWRRQGRFL